MRPPAKLFNPDVLRERGETFSNTAGRFFFDGMVFEDGFLVREMNIKSLRHEDVGPTLAEVERRGQWRDQRSLRRYGKETRLLLAHDVEAEACV